MPPPITKQIIEVIAAIAMLGLPGLMVRQRRSADQRGFAPKTLRFCAIAMLIPLLLIFGLEGALDQATIGTLVGGLMGYVLGAAAMSPTSAANKDLINTRVKFREGSTQPIRPATASQ
jgi:hypothetical protein